MTKKVRFTVDMSPELEKLLEKLANDEHTTKSEVFRRSIGLYDVSKEFQRKGNKIGAAKDEENLNAIFVF